MRDFPSCFGENGVQISDASSSLGDTNTSISTNKITQNLVTCIYQCKLHNSSFFIITITWTKTLMGQVVSLQINDSITQSFCKLEIKPILFAKNRGFKTLEMSSNSNLFEVFWDLSCAKFGVSSPEPVENYYIAISINQELVLLLGDMEKEVLKKMNYVRKCSPNAVFVAKKEHVFGKKVYATKAQFCGKGQIHDILIECDANSMSDPCLSIRIDGKTVLQVKKLQWKFRGNYTILVDGLPVEVYWDVHSWFFGKLMGNGVFSFQTSLSAEKLWGSSHSFMNWSDSLVKDCGKSQGLGFSLVICAWKSE